MILICYDGSTDASEPVARGAALLRGQRATALTIWTPFDAAALGVSGGVGSVSHAVIQHADRMVIVVPSPEVAAARARERPPEG